MVRTICPKVDGRLQQQLKDHFINWEKILSFIENCFLDLKKVFLILILKKKSFSFLISNVIRNLKPQKMNSKQERILLIIAAMIVGFITFVGISRCFSMFGRVAPWFIPWLVVEFFIIKKIRTGHTGIKELTQKTSETKWNWNKIFCRKRLLYKM